MRLYQSGSSDWWLMMEDDNYAPLLVSYSWQGVHQQLHMIGDMQLSWTPDVLHSSALLPKYSFVAYL